jgi:hypothetical protein
MQNLRKRLKALEKSLAPKRGPEILILKRDVATGQWIAATEDGMEPSQPIVLMYSIADPDLEMFDDPPPRILMWRRNDEVQHPP